MRRPERTTGILLLLAALLAIPGCASGPSKRAGATQTSAVAQRSINIAQALLDQGDAAGALDQAVLAIRADGRSPQARILRGLALEALGRGVEAGQDYRAALGLAPSSGPVLNAYGAWLCRGGRTDEALEAFNKAIADEGYRQPEQALANAGSCAAEAGRDAQAELNLRAALGLQPTHAQSLAGMARLEHRRGDALKARAFLQRREAIAPLTAPELALAIDIETAAGDARAAQRYRNQLASLAAEVEAARSSNGNGSSRQ